jgi:hypothetical protein
MHVLKDVRQGNNLALMDLDSIVAALNGEVERVNGDSLAGLRRVVQAWADASRNPRKMKVSREDRDSFSLRNLERVWRVFLSPTSDGAYWHFSPVGPNSSDWAALYFSVLLTHPLRGKVCDSPCERCKKWFVKRRASQKRFCSRRCGAIVENAGRTQKRRAMDHQAKLKKVRAAKRKWRKHPDWKQKASRAADVSAKWITRAVNNGELRM